VPVLHFAAIMTTYGEWGYSSTILKPRQQIVMSGRFHVPAALPPRKDFPVPNRYGAGWAPEPVCTLWSEEKSLTPAGNRPPAVGGSYTD
jgi:hypothetical protein